MATNTERITALEGNINQILEAVTGNGNAPNEDATPATEAKADILAPQIIVRDGNKRPTHAIMPAPGTKNPYVMVVPTDKDGIPVRSEKSATGYQRAKLLDPHVVSFMLANEREVGKLLDSLSD